MIRSHEFLDFFVDLVSESINNSNCLEVKSRDIEVLDGLRFLIVLIVVGR